MWNVYENVKRAERKSSYSSSAYLASVILVPYRVTQEVKQIVTDFIWNGKPPKIACNVMMQNIENGGLKLVDFESKVKSLKIGFIKRLLQNKDGKWRAIASHFFKQTI